MVCIVILLPCVSLEREGKLLFVVFWHIYEEKITVFFSKEITFVSVI